MTNAELEKFKKENADRLWRVQREFLSLRGYSGGNIDDTARMVDMAIDDLIDKIEVMHGDNKAIVLCPECKRELCPHALASGWQYFCHKCKRYYELPKNPCDWERRNYDLMEEK